MGAVIRKLRHACDHGDFEEVKALLTEKPELINMVLLVCYVLFNFQFSISFRDWMITNGLHFSLYREKIMLEL
jgi:hypothetical protein